MQLTIRLLGTEILHVSTDTEFTSPDPDTATDCTTYPIGFAPDQGDQRWTEHPAPDLE